MSEDRFSSISDQMELLSDADIRKFYFNEKSPDAMYQDFFNEQDSTDFDVLSAGMKSLVMEHKLIGFAFKLLGPAFYHLYLKQRDKYREENAFLSAITKGPGQLSTAGLALLQRMYSMSHLGCSTTCIWDREAREYVMMRSLDWKGAETICGATRSFHHYASPDAESPSYKSVGTVGMIGDLTVMKPGIGIAINFAPWPNMSVSSGSDPTLLLRQLCENPDIQTFDQARSEILKWQSCCPVYLTLCGAEEGQVCVIEIGYKNKKHVREISYNFIVQTNHYAPHSPFSAQHEKMGVMKKIADIPMIDKKPHASSAENWYASNLMPNSQKRHDVIHEALAGFEGSSIDLDAKLIEIYKTPPVFNYETIYWGMLRPKSDQIKIYRRERNY